MPKTVLIFGTFDKLHPGHRFFLSTAKKQGDRLVVVVARDKNVLLVKGHLPKQSEQVRLQQVQAVPEVAEARLGLEDFSKKELIIEQIKPDIICLGYDQTPNFIAPNQSIQVIRLPAFRPDIYKSSKL
ncbi:MAG: adenylyltransferase/cytidyltransferase family protein [Patescibacteria group bacterium]|jgi:FAD synthetase